MANRLFLSSLLLALCNASLAADLVFVSIDCGSSAATYKDENGIVWKGDLDYVKGGESRSVQPWNPYSHVLDTLRVFTNKTKNCYIINSVKQGRVLVRATFYYGNYDGKNSPPLFRLLFDGYDWGTVNNSGPLPSRHEVIYVMKKESISVCVAQAIPGLFPYISALEVRSLDSKMYSAVKDDVQLYTRRRVAFGSNATIRYPEDPYDRYWGQDLFPPNGTIPVSSDAPLSNGMTLTVDMPPPAVLRNAITSASPNSSIDLFTALPSFNYSVYINWYFSEVTRLKPNQTRSFYIAKDDQPFSDPIFPPYGNCTEIHVSNVLGLPNAVGFSGVKNGDENQGIINKEDNSSYVVQVEQPTSTEVTYFTNTKFSLVPTNGSTLPPLINAMEVFFLEEVPYYSTSDKDVEGLASLQEAFTSLQGWTGDPCLPFPEYAWDWVKCNYDDPSPQVTALSLGGYGLSGLLPDFSSMEALQTINLSNNSLRGNIPDFFGKFQNLQTLNLENNQFNGPIPVSLSTKKGLILRVSGNPNLCKKNTSSCSVPALKANSSLRNKKKILEILLATIIPSIILLQLT